MGYEYDAMNRLVSMTENGVPYSYGYGRRGNLETGEESGYTYNALDRRVKNVRRSAGVLNETEFVADYISGYRNDLMEYGSGGVATRNVHGRGYELLNRRADLNLEGKTYYHADFYGSPLVAADGEGSFKCYQQQTGGSGRNKRKSRFNLGKLAGDVIVNSLLGGFTSTMYYGADRAVGAVSNGIRGRRNSRQRIADNESGSDSFSSEINMALKKLNDSGLRPGQTEISKGKIKYIVDNYDPVKAQSSIYTDSTGQYLVEGHHTTVAKTILDRGTGMNMNQVSPLPPSSKNVHWTKKWYEFWKTTIKIKN